ncbi:MAG: hypothetical protein C5B54_03160 [Acidobacteria bacterium]|nr:MAG: hypothetical protein C5B54_03160 [Acidobacteriota bacterium]
MAISPFLRESYSRLDKYVGIPNFDDESQHPENEIDLPWAYNPVNSWIDYRCWIEVDLDAGLALHKPLPQQATAVDTLADIAINDPQGDSRVAGVNLLSDFPGGDVIQRMATSEYRFILKGYGIRAGYKIPIPGIVQIGGTYVYPERVQRATNYMVGNLTGGIPLWLGRWELHYMINGQLFASKGDLQEFPEVPFNPAFHIRPDAKLPLAIRLPFTHTDQRAVESLQDIVQK